MKVIRTIANSMLTRARRGGEWWLMVLMVLASCSSESSEEMVPAPVVTPEPEVVQEVAISFSGHEEEEQVVTRAGASLSEWATAFKVWGHKNMDYDEDTGVYSDNQTVFPGYTVNWYSNSAATTATNSSNWEYVTAGPPAQTIKFWDWSAYAYRFYAVTNWEGTIPADPAEYVANKAYGLNAPATPGGPHVFTMVTNCSGADKDEISANMAATPFFTRLWFSTGKLPEYASKQFGKPVVLEFLKPYARVRFIFKYVYPREGLIIGTRQFKPTDDYTADEEDKVGIARKGTVTVHYPLTGTATSEWYTMTPATGDGNGALEALTEDYDPEDDSKEYPITGDGWYKVMANNAQGSYTLSVFINGTEKKATVPEAYMQWLPGYSYTYIFKILELGGVEIELVQSAVTPWQEMMGAQEVYNW